MSFSHLMLSKLRTTQSADPKKTSVSPPVDSHNYEILSLVDSHLRYSVNDTQILTAHVMAIGWFMGTGQVTESSPPKRIQGPKTSGKEIGFPWLVKVVPVRNPGLRKEHND